LPKKYGNGERWPGSLLEMEGTLINSEGLQWIVSRDTMANQALAITPAQFLSSFGQRRS
jgi:hypothetical protein